MAYYILTFTSKTFQIVPEKVKVNLIKIIGDLIILMCHRLAGPPESNLSEDLYSTLSAILIFFSSNKLGLLSAFHRFAAIDLEWKA